MPINALIPLASRATDLSRLPSDVSNTLRTKMLQDEQPYRNALLQAQTQGIETTNQANQQAVAANDAAKEAQRVLYSYNAAKKLLELPLEQRQAAHSQFEKELQSMGYETNGDVEDDLSDEALQSAVNAMEPIAKQTLMRSNGGKGPIGTGRVVMQGGKPVFAMPYDDGSGGLRTVYTPIEGDLADNLGLTPSGQVDQAAAKAGAETAATQSVKLATEPGIQASVDAAKQSIATSGEYFKRIEPVRKSIANIEAAITAIGKGAKTGAIEQYLPSITEASVTLDNLQSQMGLDIVGATTFGALSKGELDLALNTALPTGLNEKELRGWLVNKRNSQKKLEAELAKAAIYLGKPGNTQAGYLERLANDGKLVLPDKVGRFILETE